MLITLAQINSHIGNFEGNLDKILTCIDTARSQGSDIIIFPELSTCGYPPRDFLEFNDFIQRCDWVVEQIRIASQDIAVVIGSPTVNPVKEGKDLHNTAFFIHDQKILFKYHKSLLPTYDIFDEYRYFEPSALFEIYEFKGYRIAFTICEDLWNLGNANPLYTVCPLDIMIKQSPDLVFNISASPFAYDHAAERIDVVRANVMKYKKPLFYCNAVGAQTDVVFDGGSLVFNADGSLYDELPYFEEVLRTYEVEKDGSIKAGKSENRKERKTESPTDRQITGFPASGLSDFPTIPGEQPKEKYKLIHDALLLGIRDYFGKLGFKTAILGLSGGIDSALTATLAVRALGKDQVSALMMPSRFSSKGSVDDAVQLANNLGIRYEIIEIEPMYGKFLEQLAPILADKPFNVTEENIQARIRGTLLMAASNKLGHILLNTTNKSEMSVGYGTLYGDLCGGISVLGDVYKTEVYQLVQYINKEKIWIPQNSINKPPSAELRPDQKDSDSLPPYEMLDPILYKYIEQRQGPDEIIAQGYDPALVRRILRLVNINEFKREQTAPVIRVSPKAFGIGRRMPIVGKYLG
jgi:NAD+ synthase (glutamine-hydrolysing)